jgi:hypothetical protein
MKKKSEKKQFTHVGEWEHIPAQSRKLVMLALMFLNEAGDSEEATKLMRNRWVRKLYPLPRPTDKNYNSQKAVRSSYWRQINYCIEQYIIEVIPSQ